VTRKESILDAAAQLFAAKGFEATPTAEVAKVAGVSEGTIFHHFKTKDGILVHIIRRMMDLYHQQVSAEVGKAGSGLEAVELMIRLHFRFIDQHSREILVVFRDLPAHFLKPDFPHRKIVHEQILEVFKILTDAVERGQSDGSIRAVPAEKTAFILRGLLIGLTRQRLLRAFEVPDLTEEAVAFCRRSLVQESGR